MYWITASKHGIIVFYSVTLYQELNHTLWKAVYYKGEAKERKVAIYWKNRQNETFQQHGYP